MHFFTFHNVLNTLSYHFKSLLYKFFSFKSCNRSRGFNLRIFDFNFYKDTNFTNPYYANFNDTGFQVVGVGTVGVSTDAKVNIALTGNSPSELFYRLTPVNLDIDADAKRNPIIDDDVINNSSIEVRESPYNGQFKVTGIGSTTFSFNLLSQPERDSYTQNEAVTLEYSTTSTLSLIHI